MIHVLHTITDLDVGGAEIMLLRLLAATDRSRFEPSVLSLMRPGPVAPRIETLGVPVATLGLARGQAGLAGMWRLGRVARAMAPGLLQGWMYHGNLAATGAWLRGGCRSRLVWSVHHSLNQLAEEKPLTRRLIRLSARLSQLPAAIVYCSRTSARQHEALGFAAARTLVIPNGIDTRLFRPDPSARAALQSLLGTPADRPLIGMAARAHPMKDHTNLVRALGRLRARGVEAQLVLFGRGIDSGNAALITAARDAGVQDRLSLLGERDDLPRLMPGLDLLASPSAWGEAFPLVVGEAMAAGVPCVVTDLGDCAWLVGGTGAVVPTRDPEALASAFARLLALPPAQRCELGTRARARIESRFALPRVAAMYEELYTLLTGGVRMAAAKSGGIAALREGLRP